MYELTDDHEIQIDTDDMLAYAWPILGRELWFNVYIEEGMLTFKVGHSSAYYCDRLAIEKWVSNVCEKFLFNGVIYPDIRSVSLAVLFHEIAASNDPHYIDSVLDEAGCLTNDIQAFLYQSKIGG